MDSSGVIAKILPNSVNLMCSSNEDVKSTKERENPFSPVFLEFLKILDEKDDLDNNYSLLRDNEVKIRAHNPLDPQANAAPKGKFEQLNEELEKVAEPTGESEMFLRNLSTNEDEVTKLFGGFGPISEIHLLVDKITRKLKGFGFVSFMMPEHADNAFKALDGAVFQGTMLHLRPALSLFKTEREQKLKKSAGSSHNWNAIFLTNSAITKVITEASGLSQEEISTSTKTFLENNGVCLDVFDSNDKKAERSKTVILAKNISPYASAKDLKELFLKHGVLNKIIRPPFSVTGIVEFAEPAQAQAAFRKLAYTKFFNLPLYLEWAPMGVFELPADAKPVLQLKADVNLITEMNRFPPVPEFVLLTDV